MLPALHADLDKEACERLGSCACEILTDSMLRYPGNDAVQTECIQGLRYLMKAGEHSHMPVGSQVSAAIRLSAPR